MFWTFDLAAYLVDAPWPATKSELLDYAKRTGAPLAVLENLEELESDEYEYSNIQEIWPDYSADGDFFSDFDEEEGDY